MNRLSSRILRHFAKQIKLIKDWGFVNTYISDTDCGKILIDCGLQGWVEHYNEISREIGDSLDFIFVTHGHLDHCGFALQLQKDFNCRLIVSEYSEIFCQEEKDNIFVGDCVEYVPSSEDVLIIPTPGHTKDSISLLNFETKECFVGDLVFPDGIRNSIDLKKPSIIESEDSYKSSLKLLLEHIEFVERIYCGHGDNFYKPEDFSKFCESKGIISNYQ